MIILYAILGLMVALIVFHLTVVTPDEITKDCNDASSEIAISLCDQREVTFSGIVYLNVSVPSGRDGSRCRCELTSSRSIDYVATILSMPPLAPCSDKFVISFPLAVLPIFCKAPHGLQFESTFGGSTVIFALEEESSQATINMCFNFAPKYTGPDMATITIKCVDDYIHSTSEDYLTSVLPESDTTGIYSSTIIGVYTESTPKDGLGAKTEPGEPELFATPKSTKKFTITPSAKAGNQKLMCRCLTVFAVLFINWSI